MPRGTSKINYTQKNVRLFIQLDGAAPDNPLLFYGSQWQYARYEDDEESYGDVNPVYNRAANSIDGFDLTAITRDAPDLGTGSLVVMEKIGYVPRNLARRQCPIGLYLPKGDCKSLADPLSGWDVLGVRPIVGINNRSRNGMSDDSDDALTSTYALRLAEMYDLGKLFWGSAAAANIDREVLDLVWGGGVQCGNCGPADDGSTRLYAVTRPSGAGSPGLPAEVIFVRYDKNTRGTTVFEYDIAGLGANEVPSFIDIMGQYLIVGSNDSGSYFYASINELDGTLGDFTEVSAGFVGGGEPNDIYVAGPSEAYIVGDGGYIYRLTDVLSGVTVLDAGGATAQNLSRVRGLGRTIVAVGAAATVVVSSNSGVSWAATSASPGAAALTAVEVLGDLTYYVGGASRYYTRNGGVSWVEQAISGATSVLDILFVTAEVGYTAYTTASGCAIQATCFGGALWANSENANSRIASIGATATGGQVTRLAAPQTTVDISTAYLAAGGRAGDASSDGRLLVAASNVL